MRLGACLSRRRQRDGQRCIQRARAAASCSARRSTWLRRFGPTSNTSSQRAGIARAGVRARDRAGQRSDRVGVAAAAHREGDRLLDGLMDCGCIDRGWDGFERRGAVSERGRQFGRVEIGVEQPRRFGELALELGPSSAHDRGSHSRRPARIISRGRWAPRRMGAALVESISGFRACG